MRAPRLGQDGFLGTAGKPIDFVETHFPRETRHLLKGWSVLSIHTVPFRTAARTLRFDRCGT
jgi:hypothetical protein